jgi:hypothetical protein
MSVDRKVRLIPPPAETSNYEIGYRKPPAETRFKPGRSGNPKGRPRGARNKLAALNEERLKTIIIEEAYRTIKVSEGKRQVTIPMAKAVVRALASTQRAASFALSNFSQHFFPRQNAQTRPPMTIGCRRRFSTRSTGKRSSSGAQVSGSPAWPNRFRIRTTSSSIERQVR